MSMLIFFPWLKMQKPVSIGDFELVPYQRKSMPAGSGTPLQNILDAITESYISHSERPIHQATLVQVGQEDIIRDLNDQERDAVFILSEILAICGLSCREFFCHFKYWNRDNFRIIVQSFVIPYEGPAIVTRRRDGSNTSFQPKENFRVQKPQHVPLYSQVQIDESLLKALFQAMESEIWGRFWEAIVNFNLANTDDIEMAEEMEAVFLVGAFERLLDCNRGKEDDLADRFSCTLTPTNDLIPSACTRLSDFDVTNRFKRSDTIRDMWIRDFFRLRGNLAHGKLDSRYSSSWSLRDHLLLGSFVFPLLLKSVLGKEGLYLPTEEDKFKIDLFEPLACEEHFVPLVNSSDSETHPWNQVLERIREESNHRRLTAFIERLWSDGEEKG